MQLSLCSSQWRHPLSSTLLITVPRLLHMETEISFVYAAYKLNNLHISYI